MNFSGKISPTFQKYIVKEDTGILVLYEQEDDFNENTINANNYGIHDTWTIIEAETVVDAIKIFQESYEGAKIGGKLLKQKALRIDTERKIVQLPLCAFMKREGNGRFVCHDGDNSFGDCVIGGIADFPDGDCPMKNFCSVRSFNFSKRLPRDTSILKSL